MLWGISVKRSRLSYDEWNCILAKVLHGCKVDSELVTGYIGLVEIREVNEAQVWKFNGEDIVVCDKGIRWLSILPQNDWYCITAMMNEKEEILLWYIDMIAAQGVDIDGVPYFDDLYLDLVVYPDGTIIVDDMDELEDALEKNDITQEQFKLAIETSDKLHKGILSDITNFIKYTKKCFKVVK
jgi:predicted RNA-binding protein associated with RNAse of E/G family